MNPPVLHYIFDPFCGWCYGAAPLLEAARNLDGLAIELHGGGMMAGSARQRVTTQLHTFIIGQDQRIAALSNQPFGKAYHDGLLNDTTAVLDSEPPTTAILAAEAVAARGLDMLRQLQHDHFVAGLRIADREILMAAAKTLGLDVQAFATRYDALAGAATEAHIAASRSLLKRVGGNGFPTFALLQGGRMHRLDSGPWLGRPREWQRALSGALAATA